VNAAQPAVGGCASGESDRQPLTTLIELEKKLAASEIQATTMMTTQHRQLLLQSR